MNERPFKRLPFDSLPERPRLPHSYLETPGYEVPVESAGFGRVKIHVREVGAGPPLLLIHGLMTSSYSWRYLLEPLASRYRVLMPDLPGAGRSDKPAAAYSPAALAAFLGELTAALGVRGCRAVGNSLGGYLCMRQVLRDPGLFSRLVNIHSPAFPIARLHALAVALAMPGAQALLQHLIRRSPERWVHRNVHYYDETLKSLEEAREYAAPLATREGRSAFFRYLADTMAPAGFAAFIKELKERRQRQEPFPLPLLLLYSRQDPLVPPATGEKLHALIPEARLEWLPDTSHFAHVDSPQRVAALLIDHLH